MVLSPPPPGALIRCPFWSWCLQSLANGKVIQHATQRPFFRLALWWQQSRRSEMSHEDEAIADWIASARLSTSPGVVSQAHIRRQPPIPMKV